MPSIGLFRAFVLAAFGCAAATAFPEEPTLVYRNLGPDRVLLCNNDTNPNAPITQQGYYDIESVATNSYYWYHDEASKPASGTAYTRLNLMGGINHVYYRRKVGDEPSDTVLWKLTQCRVGSAADSLSTRCYIPWSNTCQPIDSSMESAPIPAKYTMGSQQSNLKGMRQVASVVMRCSADACILSPYYADGVGDVYFDAVNGFMTAAALTDRICLEVARKDVEGNPIQEKTEKSNYKWEAWPCDVYEVRRQSGTLTLPAANKGVTSIRLKSQVSGGNLFYRIHAKVDCRTPTQFRIRRLTVSAGRNAPDYSALILVDNVIASYPNTTVEPDMFGAYDSRREGKEALGWGGAFSQPFPAAYATNVLPRVKLNYTSPTYPESMGVTNYARIENAKFHYRWRYLNQVVNDWTELVAPGVAEFGAGVGPSGLTWPHLGAVTNGPGDVEFYYTYDVRGTHYVPVDYAFSVGSEIGFGADPYEIDVKTLRETGNELTAALGTEMFTRLREGASDWESFKLVAVMLDSDGETNETYSVGSIDMELVNDHTWRGFIPTPRGMVDQSMTCEFRIIGLNRQTPGSESTYAANSNVWYAAKQADGRIGYGALPYNGFASTNDSQTQVAIDAASAYLVVEFNDEHASYTLMHASYQNFNTWTDAAVEGGFVGNNAQTSGVSGVKSTYTQNFLNWTLSTPSSGYWWENFTRAINSTLYPLEVEYESTRTPNSWIGLNGSFVNGGWVAVSNTTETQGAAWRMQGNSRGGVEYSNNQLLPNGIDSVSFSARLSQPIEFDDFAYTFRSLTDTNYVMLAKAVLTDKGQKSADYAQHQPSMSLVAYYRPGKGCYELRMSLVYADVIQLEIYRWSPVGTAMKPTLLTSCRYSSQRNSRYGWDGNYGNTLGTDVRMYPACWDGMTKKPVDNPNSNHANLQSGCAWIQNHHLSPVEDIVGTAGEGWPSVYFGVYNGKGSADQDVTYLEGGFGGKVTTYTPEADMKSKLFAAISFEDSDEGRHKRGSFGFGSRDCPARIGLIKQARATAKGRWYKNTGVDLDATALYKSETQIAYDLADDNWTVPLGRQETFNLPSSSGKNWYYGVQSLVPAQTIRLLFQRGGSQQWVESGYDTDMLMPDGTTYPQLSFSKNNYTFTPRDCDVKQFRLMTSGGTDDLRTDVVIDDLVFTQWAGDTVDNYEDGTQIQTQKWAYVRGWITGATNVVSTSQGTSGDEDDENAYITGAYSVTKLGNEYVYVFTNAATFIPKADMQIVEALIVGGGGAGGTLAGGGGGGGQVVDYQPVGKYVTAGEQIDVVVGAGGVPDAACDEWKGSYYAYYLAGGWPAWWYRGKNGGSSKLQYTAFGKARVDLATAYGGGGGGAGTYPYPDRQPGIGWTSGTPVGGGGGSAYTNQTHAIGMIERTKLGNTSNYLTNFLASCGGAANNGPGKGSPGGGGAGWYGPVTGHDENTGREIRESDGGDGDVNSKGGDGGIGYRSTITGYERWYGAGGGGGAGSYTNGLYSISVSVAGNGGKSGKGENGSTCGKGGMGVANLRAVDVTYGNGAGYEGEDGFGGGGGGGGAYLATDVAGQGKWDSERWDNANNQSRGYQWAACGGRGGCGTVILRVRPSTRYCMFQPMRGFPNEPMSIRTPTLFGLSMFSFTWRNADEHARLFVQMATNGVTGTSIYGLTKSMDYDKPGDLWHTVATIDFKDIPQGEREMGSTNFYFGLRAPYYVGVFRVMMDPAVVEEAVNNRAIYDPAWGSVTLTRVQAWDEPALTPYDWWGWNLRTAFNSRLMYLPDASYVPQGLSCTLNFSGSTADMGHVDNDPEFAEKWDVKDAWWNLHDPFVQTPVMANADGVGNIGQVTFRARKYGAITQSTSSWVTVSVAKNASDLDAQWVVKTNFEVTGNTFQKFTWRMLNDENNYQALRLSVAGARNGRGDPPHQRVLIDEVAVTEPMMPKLAVQSIGVFRHYKDQTTALDASVLLDANEQPLAGESFGVQASVAVQQLEDELDKDSIEVYVSYYAGTNPWGYNQWKTASGAVLNVRLPRSSDSPYVFRSSPDDPSSFIPPQMQDEAKGYAVLQYQVTVLYKDKAGNPMSSSATMADWTRPAWYHPLDYNKEYGQNKAEKFSIYTILDSISPRRAWINEINDFDAFDAGNQNTAANNQWVEMAVPQGYDLSKWRLTLIAGMNNPKSYDLAVLGEYGGDNKLISTFRSAYPTENYSFFALQSPATAKAHTLADDLVEGTWKSVSSSEEGVAQGTLNWQRPLALRLVRANSIVEHEVVFMATNRRTISASPNYEGSNYCKKLTGEIDDARYKNFQGNWIYVGADKTDGTLGVYTNHGESAETWMGDMVQTPGRVNRTRAGVDQYIDPNYFEPPTGTNLWLYADVGKDSIGYLTMTIPGKTGQTSIVLIVPQRPDGTYSTNITFVLKPWFEMKSVTTNGVAVTDGVAGQSGTFVYEISDLRLPDDAKKEFKVVGDAVISHKVTDADIDEKDPYYPTVVDWIMNMPEGEIYPAWFCGLSGHTNRLMSIKEMYWLDMKPTESNWWFCAGIGSQPSGDVPTPPQPVRRIECSNWVEGAWVPYTNVVMQVTMFMTNVTTGASHSPYTLRGLAPGSVSSNYVAGSSANWTSVTFKVTGALQTHVGTSDSTYLPLRLFVFGPNSFDERHSAEIEIADPHLNTSPTYVEKWYLYPWADVFYSWSIDTRAIPQQPEMLQTNSLLRAAQP